GDSGSVRRLGNRVRAVAVGDPRPAAAAAGDRGHGGARRSHPLSARARRNLARARAGRHRGVRGENSRGASRTLSSDGREATRRAPACERPRKLPLRRPARVHWTLRVLAVCAVLSAAPAFATAQPERAEAAAGEAREGGRGAIDVIARLVNFAVMAGSLVYLL